MMKLTLDRENNSAYIYIVEGIKDGEVSQTIPADSPAGEGYIFLDFDSNGKLLGIEILEASVILLTTNSN
jgi:uncharacterized protein YuzE